MAYWTEYTWIVVVGVFAAFFMAYGIGANDVANAFATSVGSKALKLWQAVIIAGIFEFAGAVLLGRGVTSTIKSSIIDAKAFTDEPEILMFGMLCALVSAGIWLLVATYLEVPVSTTHSIIGGLIGYALVSKGSDSVVWYKEVDDGIRIKGVTAVVLSWVISPVCSGIIALLIFLIVRTFIMRSQNAYARVFIFFPILVFFAVWINVFYVLQKGLTKQIDIDFSQSLWISCVTAAVVGLATAACMPMLRKHLDEQAKNAAAITATGVMLTKEEAKAEGIKIEGATDGTKEATKLDEETSSWFNRIGTGVNQDVHAVATTDERIERLHANAELFDPKAESAFRYLQIFTAMCDSFAHGANDVANSVGPFAAIWEVYRHGKILKKSSVPIWILVLGGLGIVAGLATYGYNIIRAIGVKMVKITPSRGFAIELGSAVVIITGSRLSLPLSTTHCQVGATVAIGMIEHGMAGVNWPLFAKTCTGWVFTLIVVGFLSAIMMSLGIYSPNLNQSEHSSLVNRQYNSTSIAQIESMRACQEPAYNANLDQTQEWVIQTSNDRFNPRRIGVASDYTNDLFAQSTNVACPVGFDQVPEDVADKYPFN